MTFKRIIFSICLLLNYTLSFGQITLNKNDKATVIGKYVSILDAEINTPIDSIINSENFVLQQNEVPNVGIKDKCIWLKFSVNNKSNSTHYLLDIGYPILDRVTIYELDSDNKVLETKEYGESVPFFNRKYEHPNFIFDIDIPVGGQKKYLIKIQSAEQIILPISVSTPQALWEKLSKENTLSGIYLGIILIMVFYNLFLFFSVRDKGYFYYVVYVVFVGLTQLGIKGFNYQYLWPAAPDFQGKSLVIFGSISCMATIYFTNYFLQIKTTATRAKYPLNFLLVLFGLSIVFSVFSKVQIGFQLMLIATTIETFVLLFVSLYVMIKGFQAAKYFFAAWSVLLAGSVIFLLKDIGVLPYNLYTSYTFQAASAIEMALLSFGLANRINILKKEKEISQLAALNAAMENERIIREQNVLLEEKVAERTVELQETNEDLSVTLEDLKQTQSQLVEAEKMASLGQLTAGIAHEINNPINFVTSNVAPLKRDVGMVFDTIEFIESISFAEITAEEKRKKIDAFKEDLDYDYLKIEINHLLNGIYEGSSRTAEIVKGLRIFSRVDENDLKKADINEGLDSTLIIVNNLLNSTIKIVKEYTEPLPLIECYPGKLNQVFLNIISNAIHAIRKKHGESGNGIITIRTKAFENNISVEILDNGTGMDEITQHKIYEPFFTTKDVGEGTGLGMSIVYNTIKKHNGIIKLVSKVGEGTSFIIELPINFEMEKETLS